MKCEACGKDERVSTAMIVITSFTSEPERAAENVNTVRFHVCADCVASLKSQDRLNRSLAEIARDTVVGAFGDTVA